MEKVPNVQMAAVSLALFAGIISAFVDNVATVLMVAPVALAICGNSKYQKNGEELVRYLLGQCAGEAKVTEE